MPAGVEDGVVDGDDRDAGLLGLLDDGGADLGVGHDDDDARDALADVGVHGGHGQVGVELQVLVEELDAQLVGHGLGARDLFHEPRVVTHLVQVGNRDLLVAGGRLGFGLLAGQLGPVVCGHDRSGDEGGLGDFLAARDVVVDELDGLSAVFLGLGHEGGAEAGGLALLELFSGELAVDADADDVLGVDAGVLEGAPGAEDAVVVAGVEQPVGDVGVGGDDGGHGIHARVGGVVVGQVDDVGIGEDAEFLELLGGAVGAQVADLEVLVLDGDGLDLGAGELVPAFVLVVVGDQLTDLEAGGGGVEADEGGGLAGWRRGWCRRRR